MKSEMENEMSKKYKIVKSLFSGEVVIVQDLTRKQAIDLVKDIKDYHEAERKYITQDTCPPRDTLLGNVHLPTGNLGILTVFASALPYGRVGGTTIEYIIREQ